MSQKVSVQLVDDLDGTPANETVRFMLDGVDYQIDLTDTHAAELRDVLQRHVEQGRRVGGRKQRGVAGTTAKPATDRALNQKIRTWAREQGEFVADRGRIPEPIVIRYQAEHQLAG